MKIVVAGLLLACFATPLRAIPPVEPAKAALRDTLATEIDAWAAREDFNGVVVARADGRLVSRVFGIADRQDHRRLTKDTIFQAGSIAKYFAAATAFAMADKGLLDLDAPISRYLPEYRADTAARLTLAYLLSSGSGLPNQLSPVVNGIPAQLRATPGATLASLGYADMTLAEGVARYASGDLTFRPGSAFDYSNSNWILVALILENAGGARYGELLRRHVLVPAGMTRSGVFIGDLHHAQPPREDIAIGYSGEGADWHTDYPLPAFANGGAYTTARDLLALEDALRAGELFGEALSLRFRTVQHADEGYAFGGRFAEVEIGGRKRPFSLQSGANGASRVTLAYDLETGNAVVVLANMPGGQDGMFDLSSALLERMYGSP